METQKILRIAVKGITISDLKLYYTAVVIKTVPARQWRHTSLISELQRQKQADLCEFKTSLVYKSKCQDRLQSYRETLSQKTKRGKKKKRKKERKV